MIKANVSVDLSGLKRFKKIVKADLRGSGNGPIRAAITQWGVRYRAFSQRRFVKFSRGGGDWDALKSVRARNKGGKGKKKNKQAILIDTGTMIAALNPQFTRKPGALNKRIPFGVRVGYGGPGRYADGGGATIADIAAFHQEGAGRLPKRETIVEPSAATAALMAGDMRRAMKRLADDTINETGR